MQNYFFNITDRSISGVITLFFLTLFILSFTSCEAVFEKNISSDTLVVIIPTNNDTSLTNNVQFKWENVEGASHYKLQLVEPSFSNINSFILDTNIEYEEFFYTLNPGNYQFQIRAENSAYETPWTGPYNLVVDSVSELTNQTVPLISPTDYLYSNDANFTFSWQSLFAAEYYEFELRSGSDFNSSSTTLHAANSIYATSYSTPSGLFSTEGAYSWGVKAINQSSSSAFSERTLYIDLTVPNSPISVSPAHGTSFADTVVLKWNTATDVGSIQSPVSKNIQISNDTLFTTILQTYSTSADTIQHIFTSAGTYWWRVYTTDQAGNISTFYSAHRKIIIP